MPPVPVLLVNPNRMRPPVLPLGLELVAQALDRDRLSFAVLDLGLSRAPRAGLRRAIKKYKPKAVAITVRNLDDCYYASQAFLLPPLRRLIREIKALTPAPVIVGGVGFSVAPEAALEYLGADIGIRGDGEEALPALVRQLAEEKKPSAPGLVLPGQKAPEPARAAIAGPPPSRRFFDAPAYFQKGGQGNLETQRGCDKGCIYCADPPGKGRRVLRREPESVAAEMRELLGRGVWAFHLCDAEFNLCRAHVEAVCRAILREGIATKIKWWTYALPAPMDRDLASLMARAGCAGIDFSVDAACDDMLSSYHRPFTAADLGPCAQAMRRAKIPFMFDLLLGGPGETRATLKKNISRLKKLKPDRCGVSFGVRVFPNTPLGKDILAAGPLAENPALHGVLRHNDSLLKPIFYVSSALGPDPEKYLNDLIGADPRFLFASREDMKSNYNYNNNRPLERLIKNGERGAYWDMLRRAANR
jgi:radical SAM superfamily enzyme YgiQ (UPF0313 family)